MFPSTDRRQSNRITLGNQLDKYGRVIEEFHYAKPAREDPEITPWINQTYDWDCPVSSPPAYCPALDILLTSL